MSSIGATLDPVAARAPPCRTWRSAPTFSTRRVLQQRLQPLRAPSASGIWPRLGRALQRQALGGAVAERDVAGLARRDRQRDAARGRRRPTRAASVSVSKATTPGRARPGDPGVERRRGRGRRRRAMVSIGFGASVAAGASAAGRSARRRTRLGHPPGQGAELHRLQEVGQHLRVGLGDRQVVDRLGQRRVAVQRAPAGARGGSGRRSRSGSGGACPA